jgi:putative transposase
VLDTTGRLRHELPGRLPAAKEHHLRRVLTEYLQHYSTARPHRALQQEAPAGRAHRPVEVTCIRVLRRDLPGGLIHEYAQVA